MGFHRATVGYIHAIVGIHCVDTCWQVATTQGFYVCRSTDTEFNPVPHKTIPCHAHTLAGTLAAFCPLFRQRFQKLLTKTFEQDAPLETLPVPYAVPAWMCPRAAHTFDALRADDAQSQWSEVDVLNPGSLCTLVFSLCVHERFCCCMCTGVCVGMHA